MEYNIKHTAPLGTLSSVDFMLLLKTVLILMLILDH